MSKPWQYKMPLLLGFPYFFLLVGQVETERAFYSFLAAVCTTVGFAGIGYVTNDWSDREKDRLVGKENALLDRSSWQICAILSLFLLLALLPWCYLPVDEISLALIGFELLLFVLYAFPPFRFKERGVLGLITDALYAHVVPAILASWTFYLIGDKSYSLLFDFLCVLTAWQFISGIRNILMHQVKDYQNDLGSGTNTVVTRFGVERSVFVLKLVLIPLELILFAVFLWVLSQEITFVWWVYGAYSVYALFVFLRKKQDADESNFKRFTNVFLDQFYIEWLPLMVLCALVTSSTEVRLILLVHLLLFRNLLKHFWKKFLQSFLGSRWKGILFDFHNFYKGMGLHITIMLCYVGLFSIVYFVLEAQNYNHDYFLWLQLMLSRILVAVILLHALALVLQRRKQSLQMLKEFVFEKGSAYNLAIFRILFFTLLFLAIRYEVFGSYMTWTHLPESARGDLPFIGWLIRMLPITPEIYGLAANVGSVLVFLALIGFRTRWMLLAYIPIGMYLWGVPCFFGKLNHHHIMIWIPMIFAFANSSDVLSLDSLIRKMRGNFQKPTPSVQYALPFKVLWVLFAIIYCCSGFHKLWDTGLFWALSDNLSNQIRLEWFENYDTVVDIRIDLFPVLLKFAGISVIIFEILYPLFIIKKATRFVCLIGAFCLHLSAGYFLNIDFANLRIAHLSFIPWDRFSKRRMNNELVEQKGDSEDENNFKNLRQYGLVYIGGILIAMNLLFGILQIHTWPFSSYPSYSGMVDRTTYFIEMKAIDAHGTPVDVKAIGEKNKFRWENIRGFELKIANKALKLKGAKLDKDLEAYWNLWRTKVPELEKVTEVEFYLYVTSLKPEERNNNKELEFLGRIQLHQLKK